MPAYAYSARDAAGQLQAGVLDAASLEEARGRLLERGLTVERLSETLAEPPPRLSSEDADEFVDHISRLAASGFPLSSALRAAAEETSNVRVAAALRSVADRLESGEAMSHILQDSDRWLPAHVAGLIAAALRSGRMAEALLEFVQHQRTARRMRQQFREALAYPVVVGCVSGTLLLAIAAFFSWSLGKLFADFQIQLPLATRHLFWWRETGIWLFGVATLIAVAAGWGYRRWRGPVAWSRLWAAFPLFGALFHLRGVAEWAGLMSVLLKNHVPLPDALRWSADGIAHPWVAATSRQLAEEVTCGGQLAMLLHRPSSLPQSLAPLIQWGETHGLLAEAFAGARELVERRVEARGELLRMVLPPLLFLTIGCFVLIVLVAFLMPMAYLIQGLS